MTTASIWSELSTAWELPPHPYLEHEHDWELIVAGVIVGVISPELVRLTAPSLAMEALASEHCPPELVSHYQQSGGDWAKEGQEKRHDDFIIWCRSGAQLQPCKPWAQRDSLAARVHAHLVTLLRGGHGVAVAAWRSSRHRVPRPDVCERPDEHRARWFALRAATFEAVVARRRLSGRLRAELLADIGLTVAERQVVVQSEVFEGEPSSGWSSGLRIRPRDRRPALLWSWHPQCSPDLAYLIRRVVASSGEPALVVELVRHPEAHPVVQQDGREGLVRLMVRRHAGSLTRYLGLLSPWCAPSVVRRALGSPIPHERLAAARHSWVTEEMRRVSASGHAKAKLPAWAERTEQLPLI